MGRRDGSTEWDQLDASVRIALDRWLQGKPWNLRLKSWFKGGHSGSPVAVVARSGAGIDDQVVLKFFLDGADEVRNWKTAWNGCPLQQFKVKHLANITDESQLGTRKAGPWIASLEIVGGNLARFRPLAEVSPTGELFSDACGTIVSSVVADWNDYPGRTPSKDISVSEYLNKLIDHRRLTRGTNYRAWVDGTDIPIEASLVPSEVWNPLPNPIRVVSNKALIAGQRIQMLRGCAHGDLHMRNILLPIEPLEPDEYKLIDLGEYADDAPLARDPMNLLLSIALEWIFGGITFESKLSRSLIKAIVNPDGRIDAEVKPYQEVSRSIHVAGRIWAEQNGWGEDWTRQSLLSLVACALRFIDWDLPGDDPNAARKWFFDLAAVAARTYMRRVGIWAEYQQQYSGRRTGARRRQTAPDPLVAVREASRGTRKQTQPKARDAKILPFPGSYVPQDLNIDSPGTVLSTGNQGTWAGLEAVLRNTSFDGTDWVTLAISSETLRKELGRKRSPHPASDDQIGELIQDLDSILTGAPTKSATSARLNSACSRAKLLRQWLLDLLTEPGN